MPANYTVSVLFFLLIYSKGMIRSCSRNQCGKENVSLAAKQILSGRLLLSWRKARPMVLVQHYRVDPGMQEGRLITGDRWIASSVLTVESRRLNRVRNFRRRVDEA